MVSLMVYNTLGNNNGDSVEVENGTVVVTHAFVIRRYRRLIMRHTRFTGCRSMMQR